MNFLRSRVLLLLGASLLAAASAFLFVFFPAGRKAGAVPAAPPAIPANAGGELEFAETDIDLGLVNAPIKHAIEFTNRSDRVVRIGKIVTSCNCTTTQPDKQVLQPGERGRVLLNIEPRVDHVSQSRHLITVEYEGAEPRQAHLQVHYLTRPDVVVPHEVEIRSTGAHDVAVSFTVVDFRDKPLKIATISTSSPGLRAPSHKSLPRTCRAGSTVWKFPTPRTTVLRANTPKPSSFTRTTRIGRRFSSVRRSIRFRASASRRPFCT